MSKYCEACKKEFLVGEFITHMIHHNENIILIAILAELISIRENQT